MTRYCKCSECTADGGRAVNCQVVQALDETNKVKLVYCKDCKHYIQEYSVAGWCGFFDKPRGKSDFCSSGVRR